VKYFFWVGGGEVELHKNALARRTVLPFFSTEIELSSSHFELLNMLNEIKHEIFFYFSSKQPKLLNIAITMAQLILSFYYFPSEQRNMRVEIYSNHAISVFSLAPDQSSTQITEALFQRPTLICQR